MNKYQEALNDVINNHKGFKVKNDSFWLLQELVDKETPKKVEKDMVLEECDFSFNVYKKIIPICPSCKHIFLRKGQPYCSECGQKLDWSEE
jgi:hypothetical protein